MVKPDAPQASVPSAGYLSRPVSDAIKGIALIFMFIHHFFTYPEWHSMDYGLFSQILQKLRWPFQICVPVFAFLTGYFYALGGGRGFRYSLKKITDVLISYWAVYLPLMALALGLGCWQFTAKGFLLELLALDTPIMTFCWYVWFYCAAMLLLPVMARCSLSLPADLLVFGGVLSGGLTVLQALCPEGIAGAALTQLKDWLPCIVSGFLFGKHDLIRRLLDPLAEAVRSRPGKVLLWLCLGGAVFLGRALCPRFSLGRVIAAGQWTEAALVVDVLFAPVFVWCAANLLKLLNPQGFFMTLLGRLGRRSLLMWFLHCVFFNVCAAYTQPVLYFPKNPLLVLLWGLGVCFLAAAALDVPLKWVLKKKNTLL